MAELYLHTPIWLHGIVLNYLSAGTNLPFFFYLIYMITSHTGHPYGTCLRPTFQPPTSMLHTQATSTGQNLLVVSPRKLNKKYCGHFNQELYPWASALTTFYMCHYFEQVLVIFNHLVLYVRMTLSLIPTLQALGSIKQNYIYA
jgi:hypothetical protein